METLFATLVIVTTGWQSSEIVPAAQCPWRVMTAPLEVAEQDREGVRFVRAKCIREDGDDDA